LQHASQINMHTHKRREMGRKMVMSKMGEYTAKKWRLRQRILPEVW